MAIWSGKVGQLAPQYSNPRAAYHNISTGMRQELHFVDSSSLPDTMCQFDPRSKKTYSLWGYALKLANSKWIFASLASWKSAMCAAVEKVVEEDDGFRAELLATRGCIIIFEQSHWFWGRWRPMGDEIWQGRNELGELLMIVRDAYQLSSPSLSSASPSLLLETPCPSGCPCFEDSPAGNSAQDRDVSRRSAWPGSRIEATISPAASSLRSESETSSSARATLVSHSPSLLKLANDLSPLSLSSRPGSFSLASSVPASFGSPAPSYSYPNAYATYRRPPLSAASSLSSPPPLYTSYPGSPLGSPPLAVGRFCPHPLGSRCTCLPPSPILSMASATMPRPGAFEPRPTSIADDRLNRKVRPGSTYAYRGNRDLVRLNLDNLEAHMARTEERQDYYRRQRDRYEVERAAAYRLQQPPSWPDERKTIAAQLHRVDALAAERAAAINGQIAGHRQSVSQHQRNRLADRRASIERLMDQALGWDYVTQHAGHTPHPNCSQIPSLRDSSELRRPLPNPSWRYSTPMHL